MLVEVTGWRRLPPPQEKTVVYALRAERADGLLLETEQRYSALEAIHALQLTPVRAQRRLHSTAPGTAHPNQSLDRLTQSDQLIE